MQRNKIKRLLILVLCFVLFSNINAFSAAMLPAQVQSMLMFKVLSFEKRLKASAKSSLVIGILYDSDNSGSGEQKDTMVSALEANTSKTVAGKTFTVQPITGLGDMGDVDIVYIAAGNDDRIDMILEECKKTQKLSVTGVAEYAEKGVALTLAVENKKPKIIINKSGADSCGAEFSSQILALAKVI